MLPFMKSKKLGSTVMIGRKENKDTIKGVEGEPDPGLMAAAEDLISAIHAKDAAGVVSAHEAMFDMMEMKPNGEVDHE